MAARYTAPQEQTVRGAAPALAYAVVTPARNEEDNLPRLASALIAQTTRPAAWVIVDDASTDATSAIAAALASEHDWIVYLPRPAANAAEEIADGRRQARDLDGFLYGESAMTEPADVVIKIDADVDFEPEYCQRLIERFAQDDLLGIASGTCYEEADGRWVRRTKADTTVWGATRAYRASCLPDLRRLEPCMGWDGLDEISAQLRGLRTQSFVDLPFRHHRAEGGRELSSLHQGEALGKASWYMGYRPSYLVLRSLYRALREPSAAGMIWGYAAAAASRMPQCPDAELKAEVRRRQRLRGVLRRGAPRS